MTFADGADKGLEMGNEEWGRDLIIGSSWTRIRVGMMLNVVPDGINNILGCQIRMGFSNGASFHEGDGSGQLWFGTHFGGNSSSFAGGNLVYNAGAGNPYYITSGAYRNQVINGTPTGGSGGNGAFGQQPTTGGSTIRRGCMIAEIKKTGTSMQVGGGSSNVASQDYTLANFRSWMGQSNDIAAGSAPANIDGQACQTFGSTTFVNYTTNAGIYGEVIAPHIGWNIGLTNFLRIYAIEVYRVA